MSDGPVVTFLGPRAELKLVPDVGPEVVPEVVDAPLPEASEESSATLTVSGEVLGRPGPRETLRQRVEKDADRLADAVVDAALGKGAATRGRLALATINAADPALTATVRVPRNVADVQRMGLKELRQVAEALGVTS